MKSPAEIVTRLFRVSYRDEQERLFCEGFLTHRHSQMGKIFLYLMAAFHASGIFQCATNRWVDLSPFASYHQIGFAFSVIALILARLVPAGVRIGAIILGTVNCVGYVIAIHQQDFTSAQLVAVTAIVLTGTMLGMICFFPGTFKELAVVAAVLAPSIVWSYSAVSDMQFLVVEMLTIICFGVAANLLFIRREVSHAQLEFRTLCQMAPAQIVRQSTTFGEEFGLRFENGKRPCVCISSDWRGYQALAQRMAPDRLAATMQRYYELADRLLKESFPSGNFFTDWIADELFVVVFAASELDSSNLANEALRFGQRLLSAKMEFAAQADLPIAVDVGISRGNAYLGLLGPESHRKATALGEVPGRARRVQAVGSLLRAEVSDKDRIIFGSDVLSAIFLPVEVKSYKAGNKLRDLPEDEVFYVEDLTTVASVEPRRLKAIA